MKQKRSSFSLTLSPMEIGLGWLYLAAEFLLIPSLIYMVGGAMGGFSDSFANFLYYLTNAVFCALIFHNLLHQSLLQAGKRTGQMLLCVLVAFLGNQLCAWGMQWLFSLIAPEFSNVNDAAIVAMISQHPLLMAVGTVMLVPVAEECLFRGLLFVPLYRKNRMLGYAVSTLAFCAIHVVGYIGIYPPTTLLLCFLQYIPAGLLLGWACAGSGSLFSSILVHGAINAVSFLTLR